MACWCETNEKGKTKSVEDAEAHISFLLGEIEQLVHHSTTLKVEIEQITKEKKADEQALEVMIEMRKKEAAEFTGEEKEMVESIKALEAAIIVLGEYHGKDHGVKLKA